MQRPLQVAAGNSCLLHRTSGVHSTVQNHSRGCVAVQRVCRAASAAAAPSANEALVALPQSLGGSVSSSIEITRTPDAGYGLVAREAVAPGERLIMLPPQAQLTYDRTTSPALLRLMNLVPAELWGARLALQLLAHRVQGPTSPFAPYIASLPLGFSTPTFFSPQAVAAIQYPPVTMQVKRRGRCVACCVCPAHATCESFLLARPPAFASGKANAVNVSKLTCVQGP